MGLSIRGDTSSQVVNLTHSAMKWWRGVRTNGTAMATAERHGRPRRAARAPWSGQAIAPKPAPMLGFRLFGPLRQQEEQGAQAREHRQHGEARAIIPRQ